MAETRSASIAPPVRRRLKSSVIAGAATATMTMPGVDSTEFSTRLFFKRPIAG
jgi:hypothetical protein